MLYFLIYLALLSFCFKVYSTPVSLSPTTLSEILKQHNDLRGKYGIQGLTLDENLNAFAQVRAENLTKICILSHNGSAPFGENLAMITGFSPDDGTLKRLIDMWINEDINVYNHLSQMLWSGSQRIGCAVSFGCGNTYLACNYNPPGNVNGQSFLSHANNPSLGTNPGAQIVFASPTSITTRILVTQTTTFPSPSVSSQPLQTLQVSQSTQVALPLASSMPATPSNAAGVVSSMLSQVIRAGSLPTNIPGSLSSLLTKVQPTLVPAAVAAMAVVRKCRCRKSGSVMLMKPANASSTPASSLPSSMTTNPLLSILPASYLANPSNVSAYFKDNPVSSRINTTALANTTLPVTTNTSTNVNTTTTNAPGTDTMDPIPISEPLIPLDSMSATGTLFPRSSIFMTLVGLLLFY